MDQQVIKDSATAHQTPQQPDTNGVHQVVKPASDSAKHSVPKDTAKSSTGSDTAKHSIATDTAKPTPKATTSTTQPATNVLTQSTAQPQQETAATLSIAPTPDSTTASSEGLSPEQIFAQEYPFLAVPSTTNSSVIQGAWIDSLLMPANAVEDTTLVLSPFDTMADSVEYRTSIFTGHTLQPSHSELIPRQGVRFDSIFAIVIVIVTLFACIYYRFHRISIHEAVAAFFSNYSFNYLQRERNMLHTINFMPSLLLLSATLALYVYSIRIHLSPFDIDISDYLLTLAVFIGIALVLLLRNAIIYFFGNVFENQEGATRYMLQGYLSQLLVATIMLPLLLICVYLPLSPTTYILVTSIPLAVFLIASLVRGVNLFLSYPKYSNLFLIYYLCILDIAPLLILLKVLI